MVNFFIGWHQPNSGPSGPGAFEKCLISVNRLLTRRSDFSVRDWILDCGSFTRIAGHRGHLSVRRYAKLVHRWERVGRLVAAVAQDYPISTKTLGATLLSPADHQMLSVHRYDRLVHEIYALKAEALRDLYLADYWDEDCDRAQLDDFIEGEVDDKVVTIPYIMPVVHGSAPEDYLAHLKSYGDRLRPGAWVGVGSLVGRSARDVEDILLALKKKAPSLALHGFGVKKMVLNKSAIVRSLLFSADSLAGSMRARLTNGNPNAPSVASQYLSELNLDQCALVL